MTGTKHGNPWPTLAGIAACQYGVLSHAQLREAGISSSGIGRAAAEGRIHRIFRGAYALGHPAIGERGRMFAATLACGKGAVISHRSAATLMGLLDKAPASVDVICRGERGRRLDGIRPHDVRRPQLWETGTFDGIPCTSPARTFVDLASVVGNRTLRSAFERAAARRMLDVEAIEGSIGHGGRRGTQALRAHLDEWRPAASLLTAGRLRSPLEAKVIPLLTKSGLPMPLANAPVELVDDRIEVDFLWPQHRFVLEADSRAFHATDVASERDRWRDRELMRVGYLSLRVTYLQAEAEAEEVAEAIAAHLRRPRVLPSRR
jgi:Transcriptional regulator, AbiEi antitoxin/Protein of unknown function (DUF559)